MLGVGSGSRFTRGVSDSGVSVPFSVGSSFLAEDRDEEEEEEAGRLPAPVPDAELLFPPTLLLLLLLLPPAFPEFLAALPAPSA